ncbi:maltose alpha-D-glucosyltransferase [Desulfocurvibacter africanus]|uniref:maltose alpha-D-glucosyltransferase n=1 Tax=Desulfocurvibacter africanus TaxID=873 RepID=UPI002FDB309C
MPKKEVQSAHWYKDAVIYQLHIKSFCDGNSDGIGDFKGLISRLNYLENLGVTAIWLLPFYPSPLKDDGYDIADYTAVNPDYGTLADFKRFLKEAHGRDMRVITELVLNHTSDQHEWFQRARKAKPGSAARDFYVWNDTPDRYSEARIIFQDFEHSNWSWDPVARAYYWHRFYAHQPDLNYDNPKVHAAMLRALDFWFDLGVDGLNLDAVPYLYERESTNCENLPETYGFLKKLRAHVDARHKDKLLLAQANQWPEDAVSYFGDGDACHMAFHFPLMPRMFMALEMENRYPVLDILDQTPHIPASCQWALFLRNHDDLTLEMVTDEERDYMYRIYATDPRARINLGIRRRLAPLLGNDRRKIELMNVLLMTLPGSPVLYYGDEIGMGDNYYLGDRDGVRTPMQWSADKNAGFSTANPQKLFLPVVIDPEYHYEALNVETQTVRRSSLLWWMRRLISLRTRFEVFGRGSIEFLLPDNVKVLAFVRRLEDEIVLVVANLSHHAQMVELDLPNFKWFQPEDIFSRVRFRDIGEEPYVLTLSPFAYYLFRLHPPRTTTAERTAAELPRVRAAGWESLFESREAVRELEGSVLPRFIRQQRWYGGKARHVREMRILERIPISVRNPAIILLVKVVYTEGDPEIYILPLSFAALGDAEQELPKGTLAWAEFADSRGAIYEALHNSDFLCDLLYLMAGRKRLGAREGRLQASAGRHLLQVLAGEDVSLEPRLLGAEQSNTSVLFGGSLILKLYRRTEQGIHPDLEMARFLTDKAKFAHTPPFAGAIEYRTRGGETLVLGLMQKFIPNQGDAWEHALDLAMRYFERVQELAPEARNSPPAPPATLLEAAEMRLPAPLDGVMSGASLEMAELLGKRTGQMHVALASDDHSESMRPTPFSTLYQRALFQSMQNLARGELRLLRRTLDQLPEAVRGDAKAVLALEARIIERMRGITSRRIKAQKIRIHGDYHLGQVLYTGKDFVIYDFEGEPSRPLSERRLKRSPMRDVGGMIRSWHYAAYSALLNHPSIQRDEQSDFAPWADLWYLFMGGRFLRGYLEAMRSSPLIPSDMEQLGNMLVPFMLEKAVYEMGYELNNRPDWLIIPLRGIMYLCGE